MCKSRELENLSLRSYIGNMERTMRKYPAKMRFVDTDLGGAYQHGPKMSPQNHKVPLTESQHHVIYATNLCRALDDGVEDRLHVGRRAADDAEYLGRRGLVFQSLAQFRIALSNSLNSRTFSIAITA